MFIGGISGTKPTIKPETKALLKALKGKMEKGRVETNADGEKYRYDTFRNEYNFTPFWLEQIWNRAAKAAGKEFSENFHDSPYSFHFKRAKYKGQRNGPITYKKLVILKK